MLIKDQFLLRETLELFYENIRKKRDGFQRKDKHKKILRPHKSGIQSDINKKHNINMLHTRLNNGHVLQLKNRLGKLRSNVSSQYIQNKKNPTKISPDLKRKGSSSPNQQNTVEKYNLSVKTI